MRLPMVCSTIYLLAGLLAGVNSYRHFAKRIPNGQNVPHPLDKDLQWYGVGHNNSMGTGVRNVFGEAFAKYGYDWNYCICREDSDGDGRTNGEELGDPSCRWTMGDLPEYTVDITHPGICTPIESELCEGKNDWIKDPTVANKPCEGMDQLGMEKVDIRFPVTRVPSSDTSYWCKAFNMTEVLPVDHRNKSLHMVATNVIMDNSDVMHHSLLYACGDDDGEQVMNNFREPMECGMASELCTDILAVWSVGVDWFCQDQNAGIPLGIDGIKYVVLQHHWNNPQERSDYTDSSGMTLYYTQTKRQYDSAVWLVGAPFIQIPPGFPKVHAEGGCVGECMQKTLQENIYITHLFPHMHYLGTSFVFQIIRDGKVINESKIDTYFYESPDLKVYDPPLELRPTDDIRVDCYFQSKTVDKFTYFGLGTYDEMCFAILTYYPFRTEAPVEGCSTNRYGYGECVDEDVDASAICNYTSYGEVIQKYSQKMYESCDPQGKDCWDGCKEAQAPLKSHHCFTGPAAFGFIQYQGYFVACQLLDKCYEYNNVLNAFASCGPDPPMQPGDDPMVDGCDEPIPTSAVGLSVNYIMGIFMLMCATLFM